MSAVPTEDVWTLQTNFYTYPRPPAIERIRSRLKWRRLSNPRTWALMSMRKPRGKMKPGPYLDQHGDPRFLHRDGRRWKLSR